VFNREVLREVFGAKREEMRGGWENCIVSSFMICAADRMLLTEDEMGRALVLVCVGEQECIQSFGGKCQGKRHTQHVGIDGTIILKRILKKQDGRAWS
jgi:hypothetical protein